MTDSLSRSLRKFGDAALVERYLPALTTQLFDELQPGAMPMTKQGAGSDVAATATPAEPVASPGVMSTGRTATSGSAPIPMPGW